MTTISERVEAGRLLAVEMTLGAEPAVSRYVAATRVDYEASTGLPTCFSVYAKFFAPHIAIFKASNTVSATRVSMRSRRSFLGWIRGAIERNWLIADGAAA